MIVDQDGNGRVAPGERVTMDVEVTNSGTVAVRDAVIVLTGSSPLHTLLGSRIAVGTLEPGEQKRITASAKAPMEAGGSGQDLVVSLEVSQPEIAVSEAKVFEFPLEEGHGDLPGRPGQKRNVDAIPTDGPRPRLQPSAALVIGVGAYREKGMQPVPFALHDAETMVAYLNAVVGIPREKIKVATDGLALAADLTELLDHWLPDTAQPGGTVVIYFSGRAFVDPASGAVYLMPHEGQVGNTIRAIPLRRVHSVVDSLPVKQVFLWLDVSLEVGEGGAGDSLPSPSWKIPSGAPDSPTVVQLVGVSGPQPAHQDIEMQHGLFTYYLLAGLGGQADLDGDGTVLAGELCDYVRDEVSRAARTMFQNEQRPVCVSRLGQAATARAIRVATVQAQPEAANSHAATPTSPR